MTTRTPFGRTWRTGPCGAGEEGGACAPAQPFKARATSSDAKRSVAGRIRFVRLSHALEAGRMPHSVLSASRAHRPQTARDRGDIYWITKRLYEFRTWHHGCSSH